MEYCLIEKEEWFPTIRAIIYAYRLAHCARKNRYISVVPSPKGSTLESEFVV